MRKWSTPSKAFALLGTVFALAAFFLVRGYAERARALDRSLGRPVPVVEAAESVSRGTVLSSSMLRLRTYPSGFAPPGALTRPEDAEGRVVLTPLAAGEALTETRLAPRGGGPVASLVPAGSQAIQIPTSLLPGSVRAGDRVDVLATFGGARAHVETIGSSLEVLRVLQANGSLPGPAFGGTASSSAPGTVLALLVSPDEAEGIAFARAFADLWVVLDGVEEVATAEGS
ncbi:MAG: Flp pilus assembly protein CpaB [Actinomycetota bacterium]